MAVIQERKNEERMREKIFLEEKSKTQREGEMCYCLSY